MESGHGRNILTNGKLIKKIFLLLLVLLFAVTVHAQTDTIRIATYNVLNWPEDAPNARIPYFQLIFGEIDPDLVVCQEFRSEAGANQFMDEVIDRDVYSRSRARLVFENDNLLFYKHDKFEMVRETPVGTNLRDIMIFELRYLNEEVDAPSLFFASAHLKAGNSDDDADQRRSEARSFVRVVSNDFADVHMIFGGDFNVYGSGEGAYLEFMADSLFYDPISRPGTWHDSERFADIHTQSTRSGNVGTGSSGGMDDRFDFLLMSNELNHVGGWSYVEGSYHAFGQDGDHFDGSINRRNNAVSEEMAEALYFASDHLPVVAAIVAGTPTSIRDEDDAQIPVNVILSASPNPFNSTVRLSFGLSNPSFGVLSIHAINGAKIAELASGQFPTGSNDFSWDANNYPSGIYFARLSTGQMSQTVKLTLIR